MLAESAKVCLFKIEPPVEKVDVQKLFNKRKNHRNSSLSGIRGRSVFKIIFLEMELATFTVEQQQWELYHSPSQNIWNKLFQ